MRKLIVLSFLTLDGVIQGSGRPEEDTTGGFTYGGWVVPLCDDSLDQAMSGQLNPLFDLVLGRKTYEMFAAHWPSQNSEEDHGAASLNTARKYVASHTLKRLDSRRPKAHWRHRDYLLLWSGQVVSSVGTQV